MCKACIAKVDVSGMESGRVVMCPECEAEVVVPDTSGAKRSPTPPKGHLPGDARQAFNQFYASYDRLTQGGDPQTTPTLRVGPGDDLDEEAGGPALRKSLVQAASQASSVRSASVQVPPPPRLLVRGVLIVVAVLVLSTVALVVKSRYDQEAHRDAIANAGVTTKPVVAPVQTPGFLVAGVRYELLGVVRGDKGAVAIGRLGFLVVARGPGEVWLEDRVGAWRDLIGQLAERHASQIRTTVRVIGRVRPIAELEKGGLPESVARHEAWIEIERIELVRYGDMADLQESAWRIDGSGSDGVVVGSAGAGSSGSGTHGSGSDAGS